MRKVPFKSFRNEETEPLSPPVDEAAAARNNTTMWSVDLTARQTFGISPRSKYIQKAEEGEGFETPSSWQKEDNGNGSRNASSSWAIWNKQHQQHKKTSKNYRNLLTTGGIVLAVVAVTAAGGSYAAKANASVVGFAIDSVSSGNLTRVDVDAQCTSLSSLTPGLDYFLSLTTSGQIYDYTNWAIDLPLVSASGAFLTRVGKASTTTTLNIEIANPIYVIK